MVGFVQNCFLMDLYVRRVKISVILYPVLLDPYVPSLRNKTKIDRKHSNDSRFFIDINVFHHLKLEIALAIPASNDEK